MVGAAARTALITFILALFFLGLGRKDVKSRFSAKAAAAGRRRWQEKQVQSGVLVFCSFRVIKFRLADTSNHVTWRILGLKCCGTSPNLLTTAKQLYVRRVVLHTCDMMLIVILSAVAGGGGSGGFFHDNADDRAASVLQERQNKIVDI